MISFFIGVIIFTQERAIKEADISLRDYRVPISSARSSFVSGMIHLQDREEEDFLFTGVGTFGLDFNKFYSSLPFAYDITFHSRIDGEYPDSFLVKDTTIRSDSFYTRIFHLHQFSTQLNKYIFRGKDLFGFLKFDYLNKTVFVRPETKITAGIGYGRFINATPLARALRIEEELKREGILTANLPYGILLKFAEHLAPEVRKKYQEEYYYWEREYYRNLEEILKASGVLKNQELGSGGTLVINDVLNEFVAERYYGHEFTAGVGYELSNPGEADTIHHMFVELGEKFATPIDVRAQFIQSFTIQFPFTGGELGDEFSSGLSLRFSYEVSNKIDFVGSYYLNLDIFTEKFQVSHSHESNISFIYTIINRLDLVNTMSIRRPSGVERFNWEWRTELKYRIL